MVAAFCGKMAGSPAWLLPPQGVTADEAAVPGLLTHLRNGLAHALSVPAGIALPPNGQKADAYQPECWRILLGDFIDVVEITMRRIAEETPDLTWDPKPPRLSRSMVYVTYGTTGAESGVWIDRP